MGMRTILRSIRWTWTLPILAVAATSILMIAGVEQEQRFWAAHPGFTDTPQQYQAPAIFFVQLLNGPIFFLSPRLGSFSAFGLYLPDVGRLLGIALFWAFVGFALDRRIKGTGALFSSSRSLLVAFYGVMLLLTCLFAVALYSFLELHMLLPSQVLPHWRVIKLHSSLLGLYAMLPWVAGFFVHFARKLVVTLKS
jgi:hypothetical protein